MADINTDNMTFNDLKTYLFDGLADFDSFKQMEASIDAEGSDFKKMLQGDKLDVYTLYKTKFSEELKETTEKIETDIKALSEKIGHVSEEGSYYHTEVQQRLQLKAAEQSISKHAEELRNGPITFKFNGQDVTYTRAEINEKYDKSSSIWTNTPEEQFAKSLKDAHQKAFTEEYSKQYNDENSDLGKAVTQRAKANDYLGISAYARQRSASDQVTRLRHKISGAASKIEKKSLNLSGEVPKIENEDKLQAEATQTKIIEPQKKIESEKIETELAEKTTLVETKPTALQTAYKNAQNLLKTHAEAKAAGESPEKLAAIAKQINSSLDNVQKEMNTEVSQGSFGKDDQSALEKQIADVRSEFQIKQTIEIDPAVQEVQSYLTLQGFDAGRIDGAYGSNTENGLYQYANANNIKGYGNLSPAELQKTVMDHIKKDIAEKPVEFRMGIAAKLGEMTESGDANQIKAAQVVMNTMGFKGENGATLKVDGIAGTQTDFAKNTAESSTRVSLAAAFQKVVGEEHRISTEAIAKVATAKAKPVGLAGTKSIGSDFEKASEDKVAANTYKSGDIIKDIDQDALASELGTGVKAPGISGS